MARRIISKAIRRGKNTTLFYSKKYRLDNLQDLYLYFNKIIDEKFKNFWDSNVTELVFDIECGLVYKIAAVHKSNKKDCSSCRLNSCEIKKSNFGFIEKKVVKSQNLSHSFITPLSIIT